jgi:hypothetical protein
MCLEDMSLEGVLPERRAKVPPRVVAKGEVKDERHQGADDLYSDRLGIDIEVGQGSGLMEEWIMKKRGSCPWTPVKLTTIIIGLDGGVIPGYTLQSDMPMDMVNGVLVILGSGGGFMLSSL